MGVMRAFQGVEPLLVPADEERTGRPEVEVGAGERLAAVGLRERVDGTSPRVLGARVAGALERARGFGAGRANALRGRLQGSRV